MELQGLNIIHKCSKFTLRKLYHNFKMQFSLLYYFNYYYCKEEVITVSVIIAMW